MPEMTYHFPENFLWGTATSAHQVEGGNINNNWYAWENQPGRIHNGEKSSLACDWWGGRWQEDLHNAAETGQNAHRFSIEWSRVQPAPDRWDDHALDYYRQMIKGMRALGLQPVVTLHHFTDPLWIYEMGGWENPSTPVYFEKFVHKVVPALQDEVSIWVTLNEPNGLVVNSYVEGCFPPGKKDFKAAFCALENLVRAHTAAYHAIHAHRPEALVAYALYYRAFYPRRTWFTPDRLTARALSRNVNEPFARAIQTGRVEMLLNKSLVRNAVGTQDYIALQYYSADQVAFNPFNPMELFSSRSYPADATLSENGYIANIPAGMYQALQWAQQFNLPIIITENGVEDSRDVMRPTYLAEHLQQVWRAVNQNWDIRGYFHWSQVDNFEWERGWSQRFGLWGLDEETQRRIRRPSVDLYAAICRENGISSEVVSRWAPDAFETLFPK